MMKRFFILVFSILFFIFGLIVFTPSLSYAACASPAGPAGRIEYTSAAGEEVFKYCDGTDWVPWAGEPVTSAPAPTFNNNLDDLADVNEPAPVNGECLKWVSGSSAWQAGACGVPSGVNGQIQFNNNDVFGASANLTWDGIKLAVTGDINYTGVIVDVSDIRMKYDIEPLDSSLRKLTTLNGFTFKMISDAKNTVEYGVSAQDVEKVFPELVHQVDANGTLGVNYNGLIAPMIEAIKELQAENELLKARLNVLEQKQNQQQQIMEP